MPAHSMGKENCFPSAIYHIFFLAYLRHRYLHKSYECPFSTGSKLFLQWAVVLSFWVCSSSSSGLWTPSIKPTMKLHLRTTNHFLLSYCVSPFWKLNKIPFFSSLVWDLLGGRCGKWLDLSVKTFSHKYFSGPGWFYVKYPKLSHNWAVMFG